MMGTKLHLMAVPIADTNAMINACNVNKESARNAGKAMMQ